MDLARSLLGEDLDRRGAAAIRGALSTRPGISGGGCLLKADGGLPLQGRAVGEDDPKTGTRAAADPVAAGAGATAGAAITAVTHERGEA